MTKKEELLIETGIAARLSVLRELAIKKGNEKLAIEIQSEIDYINGLHRSAEKDLGWHSVDESLPPMDEEVIVLTDELNTAPIYKIAFGHIVNKDIAIDYNGWNIPGVRFWMPMPEIPKEEKK